MQQNNANPYGYRLVFSSSDGVKKADDNNLFAPSSNEPTNTQTQVVNNVAIQMGKKAIDLGLSNIGNLTGEYYLQDQISSFVNLGSYAMMIAKGGWVGVTMVAVDIATKSATYFVDQAKITQQANILKERVGNVDINGGRL